MLSSLIITLSILGSFDGEFIFPPNDKHNHSSSIVECSDGSLLACWFHGTGERESDDVVIQGARKRAGESNWSEVFPMADSPDLPDCNPVLFLDSRQVLWLFWVAILDNEWGSALLKYKRATEYLEDGPPDWDWQDVIHMRPQGIEERFFPMMDEGLVTYDDLIETLIPGKKKELHEWRKRGEDKLVQRLGWMPRTSPIMLDDTTIMLGLYHDIFNFSLAIFTSDWGESWRCSMPIMDQDMLMLGNIQPAFLRKANGDIVACMRDNGLPQQIRQALSTDGGMNWSGVSLMDIPNPGSSVSTCTLKNGHWILACNDSKEGRHLLTLYLSEDEGENWSVSRIIEEAPIGHGNFSYPTLIQGADERIHLSYSYRRTGTEGSTIKHVCFTEKWIHGE
ncbi:MAG: neuraminidase (sialidase)-like protein [Candidatus Hydrogenedens sp.]|nr:neuraminidase (sialidase)-like protein [Candidatus Hydrogenedens sp.]